MIKIPKFANETEEADWWFEHRDQVSEEFQKTEQEGRLGRGTVARLAGLTPATVRLDRADTEKAQKAAQKLGLEYRTYLERLIHEALEKESAA
jgi:predicted DNA binding CopG/RHH family protein